MEGFSDIPPNNVWARHGMVASGHPLASQAGLQMLRDGGTAADAALAMAFATGVVMPDMCGLGGDAFALYYENDRPIRAFLGSGVLPRSFDFSELDPAELTLPLQGGRALTVPGAVELYLRFYHSHGRLPLEQIAEPAIRLAREGFLCDRRLHGSLVENQSVIIEQPGAQEKFFPHGRPLAEGDLLVQPELADSLDRIVRGGFDGFYRGLLAEKMVQTVRRDRGYLSLEDLAGHLGQEADPLHIEFDDYVIFQTPLPTPGIVLLEAMKILEEITVGPDWRDDPAVFHQIVEALRIAFWDRRTYLGDAADHRPLLREEWIRSRRTLVGETALDIPTSLHQGDTTSFVAVDSEGRAVSFIHSLALAFGSGVYVPEGGFFLNNRAGRSFNRVKGHPNEAIAGKRPMHTLNAYIVMKGDKLFAVGNTPGGDGQPQWNLTILLDLLRGHRLPHEAVSMPRFTIEPATDAHTLSETTKVSLESRFRPEIQADLKRRGHRPVVVGPYAGGGSAQVICRTDQGWVGASDPRGIGQTQGY